jgi:hypothetical protein
MDISKKISTNGTHNQALALGYAQYQAYKDDEEFKKLRIDEGTAIRLYYQIQNLQDDITHNLMKGLEEAKAQSDEKRKKHILDVIASHEDRIDLYKGIYFGILQGHIPYAKQHGIDMFNKEISKAN